MAADLLSQFLLDLPIEGIGVPGDRILSQASAAGWAIDDLTWTRLQAIVVEAEATGLISDALLLLAVFSAASVPNGRSPAAELLKFSNQYTAEDANNAIADIRSLEILIALLSCSPISRYSSAQPTKEWPCSGPLSGVRISSAMETTFPTRSGLMRHCFPLKSMRTGRN